MDNKVLITNVQRFSIHDGPGIRTTVFCKGCLLRCPWCSNPENINPHIEDYIKDGKHGTYGRYITCDELYEMIIKDEIFYRQQGQIDGLPGGVTFSGGEPLLQFGRLKPLLQRLQREGIHICVETCLFVPEDRLKIAIEYVDLFYIDVKILHEGRCRQLIGGEVSRYLSNVDAVFAAKKQVIFRVPVIGGYTDDDENRNAIAEFIKRYPPVKVELIKEHNLGESKYLSLGRTPLRLDTVTDEQMERYKEELMSNTNVEAEICRV